MKNTFAIPVSIVLNSRQRKLYGIFLFIIAFLSLQLYAVSSYAQDCIENNTILKKPPVCENSKGYLEGSQASGNDGITVATYQWQINRNNSSPNGFVNIEGATGEDYSVPLTDADRSWYRRVAILGDCRSISQAESIPNGTFQQIIVPTVRVVQPTCTVPTGTITIVVPETAVSFSIDGVNYSSSRVFENLVPKSYSISVEYSGGCKSPVVPVVINSPPTAPVGSISPANAVICSGSNQVLTATGGTSYQWRLNGNAIAGATSATYIATNAGEYSVVIYKDDCIALASNIATVSVSPTPDLKVTNPAQSCSSIDLTTPAITAGSEADLNLTYWTNAAATNELANPRDVVESGTYHIKATSSNNCESIVPVQVAILPKPTGSILPQTPSICTGGEVLLNAPSDFAAYQWSKDGILINGATTATYTATQPGVYSVVFTTSAGCEGQASTTVISKSKPNGTIAPANATICAVGGSVVLTAAGGTSYQWYKDGVTISGASAASYNATTRGTYTADIIDGDCKSPASNNVVITEAPTPSGNILPATANLCSGSTITLTASGGTTYQWYKDRVQIVGAQGVALEASESGTYTVDIISQNGCKSSAANQSVVTVTAIPKGNISPGSLTICSGGTGLLTVSGGDSYQWYKDDIAIQGATGSSYSASQPGVYTADINNGNCIAKASNSAIVSIGAILNGTIQPATAVLCSGGSIQLTAEGGASYKWYKDGQAINGAIRNIYSATSPGTYTVDLISGSCKGKASNSAVITTGTAPTGTISPVSGTLCSGGNPIVLTATGGTSYQWYRDGRAISGATTATYSATQAGVYTTDIINDNCKGKASNSSTLLQVASPAGSISPASITICSGSEATVTTTGGTSYQWYKDGVVIPGAIKSAFIITAAGTYTVDIINGDCKSQASNNVIATVSSTPSGVISPDNLSICQGGSTTLTITGGTSYQWYRNSLAINGATAATLLVKEAGIYSADVINGSCKGKASNTSTVSIGAGPIGTINPSNLTICSGGSGDLTATGGTSYQWYRNGAIIAGATAAVYKAAQAGTYSVDVINGDCKAKAANTAVVVVGSQLSGNIKPAIGAICEGGSIMLTAEGGSSYQWYKDGVLINGATSAIYVATAVGTYSTDIISGSCKAKASNTATITAGVLPVGTITPATVNKCAGETVTLTATGGIAYQWYRDGSSITGAVTSTLPVAQSGTYTVEVISSSGCKAFASNESKVFITPIPKGNISPAALTLCNGGAGILTASGGESYQWYRNGVQIAGAVSAAYTATQTGTYTVDVINGGCKATASNQSIVSIADNLSGAISPETAVICNNGAVMLSATGGSSYQWYKDGQAITGATANTYKATTIGAYTVDLISGNCKGQAANKAIITAGSVPIGNISPAFAVLCTGKSVNLKATGGTSYQWYKDGVAISGAKGESYSVSITGLYSVVIFNGSCSGPASNTVDVSQNSAISFTASTIDPNCTTPTGTIRIDNVLGGSGTGYLYSKDKGITFQTENTFTGLAPGQYEIVLKDRAGCSSTAKAVAIKTPANGLSAKAVTTDIVCGQSNGRATINVSGGQAPYVYMVDGASEQSNNVFNNLSAGTHKLQVKDAAGCSAEISFTIIQVNSTLSATVITRNPDCGRSTGSITITPAGGTPSYQYSLDNGSFQSSATFENISIGKHEVTVKDQAGCTYPLPFELKPSGTVPTLVINNPSPICGNATTSLKESAITAGSENGLSYTYWTNSSATSPINNPEAVGAGTYYIKGTNAAGCFSIKSIVVALRNTPPGTIAPANPAVACGGEAITLTASTGAFYQWYKDDVAIAGATSATYKATQEGKYTVVIGDGTCSVPASNVVTVQFQACIPASETKVFVPTAFTPNRNGQNELLQPYLLNVRQLVQFKVYNRWGQQVYQNNVIGQGWDGTLKGVNQPAETYSWILECIDFDGKVIKQSGRSLLIR